MTRQQGRGGRTTEPTTEQERAAERQIPPLRKRNPVMFWFIMLAVAAMVLSTVAGYLSLIL